MTDFNYVAEVLGAVSRKHAVPVMVELATNEKRYKEIAAACGLDDQQLSRALRELLSSRLVERTSSTSEAALCVRYSLTWKGEATLDWLQELEYVLGGFA
jgi:DNA-binding HxlR family transcriptional regulator